MLYIELVLEHDSDHMYDTEKQSKAGDICCNEEEEWTFLEYSFWHRIVGSILGGKEAEVEHSMNTPTAVNAMNSVR